MKDRIESHDARFLDPPERAEAVLDYLATALGFEKDRLPPPAIHWDLVCFAAQYLASLALASDDDNFLEMMKEVNRFIMTTHYSFPRDSPTLGKSRIDRLMFWYQAAERLRPES